MTPRAVGPSAASERGLMRIFVAVFPPVEVQERAAGFIEKVRTPGDRVSWVKRENLHYTIRFLGDLGESGATRAAVAVRNVVATIPAFDAVLGGPGTFPASRSARVLWLGLATGGEPLIALARAVQAALGDAGFGRDDKPFKPHLTIGRVRQGDHEWKETFASAALSLPEPPAPFRVERVVVVHSTLSPKGSTYRIRDEAPLS